MRRFWLFSVMGLLVVLVGCKGAQIDATVVNDSGAAVSLLEVDYPSASFGKGSLAAGGVFHYRFKIIGSGLTKVVWTDGAKVEHTVQGPPLVEGQDGYFEVTLKGPAGAKLEFKPR